MKKSIVVIILMVIGFSVLFGQKVGGRRRAIVVPGVRPGQLLQIGAENVPGSAVTSSYVLGTKIDSNERDTLNVYIKKERWDKLFPHLYKMLSANYKSQICNEYSCKPLLLYIKYYLTYKKPRKNLYKKFIDYIQKETAGEIRKIVEKEKGERYDINTLVRLIMVNPYTPKINKLLDIFFKEVIEVGSTGLIESIAKYFKSLKIHVKIEWKKYLRLATLLATAIWKSRGTLTQKEEDSKTIYEVFRSGAIYKGEDNIICKDEKHDVDLANLEEIFQYPTEGDPNVLYVQGHSCFNITSKINSARLYRTAPCSNVSYVIYKNNIKKNIFAVDNPFSSVFFRFSKGYEAFNMFMHLPPSEVLALIAESGGNPALSADSSASVDWTVFSKVLFGKNSIVYSGNILDSISVCKSSGIWDSYEGFVGKHCIFFSKNQIKQLKYEKYYVLDVNFNEDTKTLYALLAIEETDFFRISLHSFNVPSFSLKWKNDIATYNKPYLQRQQFFGGFTALPDISRHNIIFSSGGNIVILSANYFVSVEERSGMINFYVLLNPSQNQVKTSFYENIIIQKEADEIIFMAANTSVLYKLDIGRGIILKRLDLLETEGGKVVGGSSKTIIVPGIIKNSLVYYIQSSPSTGGVDSGDSINAINLYKFEQDKNISIPVSFLQTVGPITFIDINCKYIFIGTSKGVLIFTRDWKIVSTSPNADPTPVQISFSSKKGDVLSIVPDYMFSYKGFLFVFSNNNLYVLYPKKKKIGFNIKKRESPYKNIKTAREQLVKYFLFKKCMLQKKNLFEKRRADNECSTNFDISKINRIISHKKLDIFPIKKDKIIVQKPYKINAEKVIIKADTPINFNKIYKSFVIARKNEFNEYFRIWKRYGPSLEVPLFIVFNQKNGFIPYNQNYLSLGSRFLIIKDGRVKKFLDGERGWLGISYRDGYPFPYAEVIDVLENSSAKKHGIQKEDKILAIDTFNISYPALESLGYRIWSKMPGQSVVLKILRENKELIKTIKLGSQPINISEDFARWIKIYKEHLLIYRESGVNIVNINTNKRVWRFPPGFNFPYSDSTIFDSDEDFIYGIIATKLNIKDPHNRDVYDKKNNIYFIKIDIKTLQTILVKKLLFRYDIIPYNFICGIGRCYFLFEDNKYGKLRILLINSSTGKRGKIFTSAFKKGYLPNYFIFLPGEKAGCLVSVNYYIRSPYRFFLYQPWETLFPLKKMECFYLNKEGSPLRKIKKKFSDSIAFNENNILFVFNNKLYGYNLDKDKVYFLGVHNATYELYNKVYKILPDGIAILYDGKKRKYISISYVKNSTLNHKRILIPKNEKIVGLVSNDKWFSFITTQNEYNKKVCWKDKSLFHIGRCPNCYSVLYPFFNNRIRGSNIKISIYLYSTEDYRKVFQQKFNLGKKPNYSFTLRPYILLNKIYINLIGSTKKEAVIKIYPFTIMPD